MKIAVLGTKGIPGHHGVEVVVDALCPHLSALGHQLTVYGYESYCHDASKLKQVQLATVGGATSKNLEMISHMWLSARDTRRRDFDIVHIHSTDPCLLSWLPKSRYGVIATSHGQAYLRQKWSRTAKMASQLAEVAYAYCPKMITSVSKPLADIYRRRYRRYVHYIPNGIELIPKPSVQHLERFGLHANDFLFCSAGRIEKTKGLHTLMDAYARTELKMPLVIAGGGRGSDQKYFDSLRRQAPQGVNFLGFLTGEAFFSLYAHATAFIFPSEYEAMSMALLEGLSFGTPTIYSDLPENHEVANGIAFPFPVGDSNALAEVIRWVVSNPIIAGTTGEDARAHIRKNHAWRNIANQYDQLYRQMAA